MPLSFIPIPALIAIIAALYSIVKPSLFFEPAWLLPITNTVFVTVVFFIVAYIAMRNYRATGRIQILLLGCGVLAFGIGGIVAGLARSVPGAGANLNVTIYNTSALIGAIFHFIAAWILLAGISPEVGSKRKEYWLIFAYAGLTVFMSLFTMASLKGLIPLFFIQGVGPTILRQWVLGSADILFSFSFFIFMGSYLRNREVFLYWYSSALALTAISLTAFFIESAVGSAIGWVGRSSQYLGGIYFLIAIITAARSAQARRTSFDNILTGSLSLEEEKFRALAENSPDIIDRFDREMKHIYVNPAGLRLYQKPAGSIIGKKIEEAGLSEAYSNLLKEKIQKVFETGQPEGVEDYLTTEKGIGFYQSHCVPEYGVDGTVDNVLVVSRDLTERKQMEEALHEREERYRSLFNGMTEGFALHEIICDPSGKPVDYRFLEINPAFERLTGLKRETLIGKTVLEAIPGTELVWIEKYGQVALTGQSVHFDRFFPPLGKHYEVFAYRPAPGQFAVIFIDITERKQTENALRRSEERFRKIFEEGPLGMAIVGLDYHLVKVNAMLCQMLGYTQQELTNLTFAQVTYPEDVDKDVQHVQRLLRGEISFFNIEKRYLKKNGEVLWGDLTGSIMGDETGHPLYLMGMVQDITERKRMEEELRRSREDLEKRVQERTAEICRQAELLDLAHDAIIVREMNGVITFWNEGATEMYGWKKEEALGKIMRDLLETEFTM
jgi:PAS domain S-box-containing protein